MAFNSSRHTEGAVYDVLAPQHEVDSLNGEELKKHIQSAIAEVDAFMIDFHSVAYVNSSGLRELIQMMKHTSDAGKKLFLVNVPEEIHKIFVHTNLDRLFTFYDTV